MKLTSVLLYRRELRMVIQTVTVVLPKTRMTTTMTTRMMTRMMTTMTTKMTTRMATTMTTRMMTTITTKMTTRMATTMTTKMTTRMRTKMTTRMATTMTTKMTTTTTRMVNLATECSSVHLEINVKTTINHIASSLTLVFINFWFSCIMHRGQGHHK